LSNQEFKVKRDRFQLKQCLSKFLQAANPATWSRYVCPLTAHQYGGPAPRERSEQRGCRIYIARRCGPALSGAKGPGAGFGRICHGSSIPQKP